jgi:hypothetical protein
MRDISCMEDYYLIKDGFLLGNTLRPGFVFFLPSLWSARDESWDKSVPSKAKVFVISVSRPGVLAQMHKSEISREMRCFGFFISSSAEINC